MTKITEGMLRGFKAAAQDGLNRDISTRATSITLLLLIEEIERLRAEVEALRNTKDPLFVLGFGTPDAAPAPVENAIKVGDMVRIVKKGSKLAGRIGEVVEHDRMYTVEMESDYGGHSFMNDFTRDEIEPA